MSGSSSLLDPDFQIEEPLFGENLNGKDKTAVRKNKNCTKGNLEGDNFTGRPGRQNCRGFYFCSIT